MRSPAIQQGIQDSAGELLFGPGASNVSPFFCSLFYTRQVCALALSAFQISQVDSRIIILVKGLELLPTLTAGWPIFSAFHILKP